MKSNMKQDYGLIASRILICTPFLILMFLTGSKLYKMAQIKGFVPGRKLVTQLVTGSGEQQGRREMVYWISWGGADWRVPSNNRTNLPEEIWENHPVGSEIQLVQHGETFYHPNGIFVSPGNFVFDVFLMLVWAVGVGWALRPIWET